MKISIITVTLNSEKYLERAIKSVVNQSYKNLEFLIIDGESDDNTQNIINKYKEHIDCYIREKDNGIYDAFNKGILNSTGDIVYFLNSDDYLVDKFVITDIMNQFELNKSKKIIYADVKWLYEDGSIMIDSHELNIGRLKKGFICPHQGTFYRKEVLQLYNGFNTSFEFVADAELVIQMFLKSPEHILHVDRIVSIFRVNGFSTKKENRDRLVREKTKQISKYFGKINAFKYYINRTIEKIIDNIVIIVNIVIIIFKR